MSKPIVAIIGRPNVGKSTLFNRLTRTTDALVHDFPGVTRDRNFGTVRWDDAEFTVVDTGGYIEDSADTLTGQIQAQIGQAIADADVILHVLDGKSGMVPSDADLIEMLRTVGKPVFYAVNKIDGYEKESHLYEFYQLGIDNPYPISAQTTYGIRDLVDAIVKCLPKAEAEPPTDLIRVAVVGRPNVGKSSLINRIIGTERLIVSDIPGTTRDSVDTLYTVNRKSYLLIDTAGIRKKSKVSQAIEKLSVLKALKSLERCDIALMMLDASEGITDQDISIAGYAYERGCGCIFLLNKWDQVANDRKTEKQLYERLRMDAKFLHFAPAITVSALTGYRISKIFKLVNEVYRQYSTRISTAQVNKILHEAVQHNEPPFHKGKRIRYFYATQVSTQPPTFICFVSYPDGIHFSYQRYLINQIREKTGLNQTPIRMFFRERTPGAKFKPDGDE